MRVKTSELIGVALRYAVAKALGYTDYPNDSLEHGKIWHTDPDKTPFGPFIEKDHFKPDEVWAQGGPIIEQLFSEGLEMKQGAPTAGNQRAGPPCPLAGGDAPPGASPAPRTIAPAEKMAFKKPSMPIRVTILMASPPPPA